MKSKPKPKKSFEAVGSVFFLDDWEESVSPKKKKKRSLTIDDGFWKVRG